MLMDGRSMVGIFFKKHLHFKWLMMCIDEENRCKKILNLTFIVGVSSMKLVFTYSESTLHLLTKF